MKDPAEELAIAVLDTVTFGSAGILAKVLGMLGVKTSATQAAEALEEDWRQYVESAATEWFRFKEDWERRPAAQHPSATDVAAIMDAVRRVYRNTADWQKRALLRNALINSLDPEQYEAGLTRRLLAILDGLEYGDIRLLGELNSGARNGGEVSKWNPTPGKLWAESLDAHHLQELAGKGLVWTSVPLGDRQWGGGNFQARVTELGKRMVRLVAEPADEPSK